MPLTDDERAWLGKRKSGDITIKQQLVVGEVQTRAQAWKMPEGSLRELWLGQCAEFRADVDALPDDATVKQQGDLMQRLNQLHNDVLEAARG